MAMEIEADAARALFASYLLQYNAAERQLALAERAARGLDVSDLNGSGGEGSGGEAEEKKSEVKPGSDEGLTALIASRRSRSGINIEIPDAPPPRPVRRDHRAKLDELQIGERAAEHERELVAREHVTCSGEYDEGLGLPLIGSESGHFGSGRLLQT
jgi:hypothetical protein